MTERVDEILAERAKLVALLNRTAGTYVRWRKQTGIRPPGVFDDFFNALADAGIFNRAHPDYAIPAMVEDQVPFPQLGAPLGHAPT